MLDEKIKFVFMLQNGLIIVSFLLAICYLGRLFYNNFFSDKMTCPGCSGCESIDFAKIEKEVAKNYGS